MARTQIRSTVGVVTTTLGLAVLLAGPPSTLGLGVPTVDSTATQVATSVEGAVQTTQETAATTVTQVETTVQSTVQTTQQVATAPQPAPAPAAPTQTASRVSAPAKKPAGSRVVRPAAPAKRVATTVAAAQPQGGSASAATPIASVKRSVAARTRTLSTQTAAPRSHAAEDPAPQCDLPLLSLLPGGDELRGLLAVACDAAGGLDLGARLGLTPHLDAATQSSEDAAGAAQPGSSGTARARAAAASRHPFARSGVAAAADAAGTSRAGAALTPPRTGVGRGHGLPHLTPATAARVSAASAELARGSEATHQHHSWFSGQSRGTELLLAIIFANMAILGGIALWRLAVRWVIPRFA